VGLFVTLSTQHSAYQQSVMLAVKLSVFTLSVVMLSVVMLSVVMLSVVMLSVVAPASVFVTEKHCPQGKTFVV
jgi:hypothetical protein